MKKLLQIPYLHLFIISLFLACKGKESTISKEDISAIQLKRGTLVLCGPEEKQFGTTDFEFSGSTKIKADFNLAIALLHSFEYEEAEKVFAKIIDEDPDCAMAYWGVAMCNYHALWTPPTLPELKKGSAAVAMAQRLKGISKRESAYIAAIAVIFTDWDKIDYHTRTVQFEKAMQIVYVDYPKDKEAAIFYALSLDASADPTDKSFVNQKKAGTILMALYPGEPMHPGIVHYLIHSYDYPTLAEQALPFARKYAQIAPSSSHAQHMPSHIFIRLGLWDECIQSNLVSVAAAKCYAENSGIKGHWDEELHGLDYLVYAYLQKGDNDAARAQWDYLKTIQEVYPTDFKVAYAFAAIPSRYLLENKMWNESARLDVHPAHFTWEKFPWQKAIFHFTRAMGAAHIGSMDTAQSELTKLMVIHDTLIAQKDAYKANQVDIQIKTANAWILFKKGKRDSALVLMKSAADMEDATEKHPVTPGSVIPARELLGDLYMEMNDPAKALEAYEEDLKEHANRFNGLYGAGLAAEKSGDRTKAKLYYKQLLDISASHSTRMEIGKARSFK